MPRTLRAKNNIQVLNSSTDLCHEGKSMPKLRNKLSVDSIACADIPVDAKIMKQIVTRSHAHDVDVSHYVDLQDILKSNKKKANKRSRKTESAEFENVEDGSASQLKAKKPGKKAKNKNISIASFDNSLLSRSDKENVDVEPAVKKRKSKKANSKTSTEIDTVINDIIKVDPNDNAIVKKRNRKSKKVHTENETTEKVEDKKVDIENETVRKVEDKDDTKETTFYSVKNEENETTFDLPACVDLKSCKNLSISQIQQIDISQNDSIMDKASSTMLETIIESERSKLKGKRMPLSSIYSRISGIEEITLMEETLLPILKRESTYIKQDPDQTPMQNNISANHSLRKHTFSAASPCKLFKNQYTNTMFSSPPRSFCKSISVGSAGCTPMPPSENLERQSSTQLADSTPKGKVRPLNVTHSVEKVKEVVSAKEVLTKTNNRVTFVSPSLQKLPFVHNTSNIIKSSLKNTNKSILVPNKGMQRSNPKARTFTNELDKKKTRGISKLPKKIKKHFSEAKEKQIANIIQSACKLTPAKTVKIPQPLSRSKMPNFASLHQKQFDQMESLVQLQARKEQRAKQLFSATTPNYMKGLKSKETSSKTEGSGEMQPPTVTRFGFKINSSGFKTLPAVTYKDSPRPKLPTPRRSASKTSARDIVMKDRVTTTVENSRNENRNYIAGVRTNRRFELQMKARKLET